MEKKGIELFFVLQIPFVEAIGCNNAFPISKEQFLLVISNKCIFFLQINLHSGKEEAPIRRKANVS